MIIKTHKELAAFIENKKVLHLNSLGKDSAVCLEWLVNYAKPSKVVALNFESLSGHPDDEKYLEWQKKRYPSAEFITAPNTYELTDIIQGVYQRPGDILSKYNYFNYVDFDMFDYVKEVMEDLKADYVSMGHSRYESVTRASQFHKKGLVQGNKIYPIGMFSKKQVYDVIKAENIKLHPCYKLAQTTYDHPSYYKMRAAFIANPKFKEKVYKIFPMLRLDEYRYRKLFKM